MFEQALANERQLLTLALIGAVLAIAILEAVMPRRRLEAAQGLRWSSNLLLYLLDATLARVLLPVFTVGAAIYAQERGWGLLNLAELPIVLAAVVTFAVIDFSRYFQHWLLHRVPLLWRLHRVHHTDPDYDFSTGLRFHPLEAACTLSFDIAVVLALGAPPIAVLGYELVKAVWAAFAHANIFVPLPLDRALRRVFVTPDLHRVHHSAAPGETNSNFGGITPLWDRLCGTYLDQPAAGHTAMVIGLPGYRGRRALRLGSILLEPFRAELPPRSEHEVQNRERDDQEQDRHDATDAHEVGHAVTAGAHDQGVHLVGRNQERI